MNRCRFYCMLEAVQLIPRRCCDRSPDLDGSVRQDLPVAGPAAAGFAAVAGCLAGADGAEARLRRSLARLPVFRRKRRAVPRLEAERRHPVDLHERVVKLGGRETETDAGVNEREERWMDEGTDVPTDGAEVKHPTLPSDKFHFKMQF